MGLADEHIRIEALRMAARAVEYAQLDDPDEDDAAVNRELRRIAARLAAQAKRLETERG